MTDVLLARGLTKTYPGVVANSDVSFDIKAASVHALLGENGAGKSTLVKTIYGLVRPDSGSMALNGTPYAPAEPRAARAAGVTMVFQHFSLFDALSVAENIALGMESPPPLRDLSARIRDVSREYGLPLDPRRTVGDLSAGERQRVEIVRCLLQDPKLLIMDEPTSVLTPQEVGDPLRHAAEAARGGDRDPLHLPQARGDPRDLRGGDDPAGGPGGGDLRPARDLGAAMAEMMVGGTLKVPARAASRGRRRRARGLGALGPLALAPRHARSGASPSRCGAARCWGSAASRGTGRTSCSWRFRARPAWPPAWCA
jgi:simple sugar transport system ATP-binding protein